LKENLMKSLLTLIALLLAAASASAQQWTPTSGPEGAQIAALAASGRTLLALSSGYLYRHDDHGWENLGPNESRTLHVADSVFFMAPYDGLYRSLDRGDHWEKVGPEGVTVRLCIDGSVVYAMTDSLIYRSLDHGKTWTPYVEPQIHFFSFFVRDSVILAGSVEGSGMFRSGDSGKSWSRITAGLPADEAPSLFAYADSSYYTAVGDKGVFRSTDNGLHWSALNDGLPVRGITYPLLNAFLTVGDTLWAAENDGVYFHADSTWHIANSKRFNTLAAADGVVYNGSSHGVDSLSGPEGFWTTMNTGLRSHRSDALAAFDGAVYSNGGGWIHRSADNGESWEMVTQIDVDRFVDGGATLYALGRKPFGLGIFRSSHGLDWEDVGAGLPHPLQYCTTLAAQGDTLFTGFYRVITDENSVSWKYGGVYRSLDRGTTWDTSGVGLPNDGNGDVPVVDIIAAGRTVLAWTYEGLYRSADGGDTWGRVQFVFAGEESRRAGRLFNVDGSIYLALGGLLYRSDDDGRSWGMARNGLPPSISIFQMTSIKGTPYLIANNDKKLGNIFRWVGESWADVTSMTPEDVDFRAFLAVGDDLLAGTLRNSVWKGRFDAPSGVGHEEHADAMMASAPNPFSMVTTICFTLARRGDVRLTLVSPLGEEMALIHNGPLEAGLQRIRFDGSSLPSGIYRLRLATGDWVRTTPLVKVR